MKSLTITATSVVLNFPNPEDRDRAYSAYRAATPRETHGNARAASGEDGSHTLAIRLQDITHPVTIPLDGGTATAPANMSATTGLPTHASRFTGKNPDQVPGANAEARVNERETTSGVSLMKDTPGAVNNDPSTASNAGYEGSPAQAIQAAAGNGPNTPTPGGFVGPDKAADIKGAAPGTTVPALSAETLHPEGQKQDEGAVKVQRAADTEAKEGEKARTEGDKAEGTKAAPTAPKQAPRTAPKAVPPTAGKTVTPAAESAERTAQSESAPNSGKTESEASAAGVDR